MFRAMDASIKLWSLRDEPEDEEDVGGKKRKLETGALSSIEKQVGLVLHSFFCIS